MIELECPSCDKQYKFKDEALSKSFECPCGKKFIIEPMLELEGLEESQNAIKAKKEAEQETGGASVATGDKQIPVTCPFCQKKYKFKSAALSKNYVCECGQKFIIEPTVDLSEEVEEESPRQKKDVVYLKGEAAKSGVNLKDKKVCSKCKAIIPITSVKCPQCDYNTLNIKYDQQKRDEISFESISTIIKYGKYIFPVVVVLIFLGLVRFQNGKIDLTKDLISYAETQLDRERSSVDVKYKITRFRPASKNKYIVAESKKDSFDLFALGNGWISLKTPGVRFEVEFSNRPGVEVRCYIWNEDKTDVIWAKDHNYNINDYQPIGLLLR